jgi:transglutaminase-like putative cysteine protease
VTTPKRVDTLNPAMLTLSVAGATILGIFPIGALFTDNRWFMESIGAIAVVCVPAAVLRYYRGRARTEDLLLGLVLLVLYTITLYLHRGSFLGFLPGSGTIQRIRDLQEENRELIRTSITPVRSTAGLRLYVIPAVGLVAALTDWLTNVRRAPALAGISFLATFTIVGAVHGSAVGWWQFCVAACGYLIVLVSASRRETAEWGRLVPRSGQLRDTPLRLSASGARIGAIAVVLAVVVPSVLPGLERNILADAFRGGGHGSGGGVTISAFADLAGQLRSQDVVDELRLKVTDDVDPFYIRVKTLDTFTGTGWRQGNSNPAGVVPTPAVLARSLPKDVSTRTYEASFTVLAMKDNLGFLSSPMSIDGLRNAWRWDPDSQTFIGTFTRTGEQYREQVAEITPTIDQLNAATAPANTEGLQFVPKQVDEIVKTAIGDAQSPYEKALALMRYLSPANGFSYDLLTHTGDTGSALLDFLETKRGFCQQYAAAMAIMLRVAGIDARVVLGYTHGRLDADGEVVVTSHDAHAWVEARFDGIGWLPFDPTPLTGADAARAATLPWVPTDSQSPGASGNSDVPSVSKPNTDTGSATSAPPDAGSTGGSGGSGLVLSRGALAALAGLFVIALFLGLPALRRQHDRARRVAQARTTNRVLPLWQELRASAADAGAVWPPPTTPRQVPGWLTKHGVRPSPALTALARDTERELYADPDRVGDGPDVAGAVATVRSARKELMDGLPRRRRWWARFWPASRMRRSLARRTRARRQH